MPNGNFAAKSGSDGRLSGFAGSPLTQIGFPSGTSGYVGEGASTEQKHKPVTTKIGTPDTPVLGHRAIQPINPDGILERMNSNVLKSVCL